MMRDATVSSRPVREKHIPALDGIRGLAVLIVFFFHYGGGTHSSFKPMQLFGFVNKGGWSGVILFFVLSGFLITGILWDSFEDPHWWRKFFARRTLRIFPLYYFALLLVVVGSFLAGTGPAALRQMWIPGLFLENFPYLNALADNIPSPLGIFHLWSIAVEEQFYLVWPFLLVVQRTRQHAKWLCAAVFAVSLLFRAALWTHHPQPAVYDHFLLTHAGALAAGGWLALSVRGPEWASIVRSAPVAGFLGLAGFLVSGVLSHNFETSGRYMMTFGLPCVTILFSAVLARAVEPGLTARIFSMGWLRWLGNLSYGIYVFHMLFLGFYVYVAHKLAGGRGPMVQNAALFLTAAVLTVLAAMLSYNLFEKQFLRLKKYFVPRTMA